MRGHTGRLALGYIVPVANPVAQSMATVRVMTFNTKQGVADAQQIVETIREEHIEVLAMQEVSSDLLNRLNDGESRIIFHIPLLRSLHGMIMAV